MIGLALASFALMWIIAEPGFDNTRAYEGTDTRAGALLVGAALAILWRGGLTARAPKKKRTGKGKGKSKRKAVAPAPWWLEVAGEVKPEWFGSDRIHYTSEGDRQQALPIADALAVVFPASRPTEFGCLVGSGND